MCWDWQGLKAFVLWGWAQYTETEANLYLVHVLTPQETEGRRASLLAVLSSESLSLQSELTYPMLFTTRYTAIRHYFYLEGSWFSLDSYRSDKPCHQELPIPWCMDRLSHTFSRSRLGWHFLRVVSLIAPYKHRPIALFFLPTLIFFTY